MKNVAVLLVSVLFLCTAGSNIALASQVDSVTAGGWITGTPTGERANFGVNAKNTATPSGHLKYVDHGSALHVKSDSITSYTIVNATTRTITGTCTINGVAGATFTATLVDNGEPGTADTFSISLSTGYAASGTLGGGNIQVKPKKRV